MIHVTINGKDYEFDNAKYPLGEVIALEKVMGLTFDQWQKQMEAGSMLALAGLLWLVLRRNGEKVKFSQIESGEFEIDMASLKMVDPDAPENNEDEDAGKVTPEMDIGTDETSI